MQIEFTWLLDEKLECQFLTTRIVEFSFAPQRKQEVLIINSAILCEKRVKIYFPKVLQRPKRSVVDLKEDWLKSELKDWVNDIFSSKSFAQRGIFNQKRSYQGICNRFLVRRKTTSFHIFQNHLNLELWFRELIDH